MQNVNQLKHDTALTYLIQYCLSRESSQNITSVFRISTNLPKQNWAWSNHDQLEEN